MTYGYIVFSPDETHIATVEGDDFNSAGGRLAVYLEGEIVAEFAEGAWCYWLRQDLSEDVAATSTADDKPSHVPQAIENSPVHAWGEPTPWGKSLYYDAAPNNAAFNKVDFSQRVELGDDLANQIQDIVRKLEELRTLFEQGGDSVG